MPLLIVQEKVVVDFNMALLPLKLLQSSSKQFIAVYQKNLVPMKRLIMTCERELKYLLHNYCLTTSVRLFAS